MADEDDEKDRLMSSADGFTRLVLLGTPQSGKSTFFNYFCLRHGATKIQEMALDGNMQQTTLDVFAQCIKNVCASLEKSKKIPKNLVFIFFWFVTQVGFTSGQHYQEQNHS